MIKGEEISIKVHCIISCLCEAIREQTSIDYRPFYFGLWDAPFDVTEEGEFTYYQHDLNHDHYFKHYEALFGAKVHEWYDHSVGSDTNFAYLQQLVKEAHSERYVVAQIDMSLMPERENKFNQKPFPHFLILRKTSNPDEWDMIDADFRWRGTMPVERIREAFIGNAFGGGFYVEAYELLEAAPEAVDKYFDAVFQHENTLTIQLKAVVKDMGYGHHGRSIEQLARSVRQLPVLAIRKYSYEHALMYFLDETDEDQGSFESYCDMIEELVKGYHQVQYLAIKMGMTKNGKQLALVLEKLEEMDETETRIKQEVYRLYQIWHRQKLKHSQHTICS
ncbi:DUF6005 family protein [Paenibacillus sp. 1001270B_150601_E10]|uniref:DUF6005 family protein n=1 Tax=Paenibacillus sp. 1001270B_150601_E10 TaxID=2787079 RepID=UPI001E289D32|nr:DUF6005 family protein [Paenibacillus sp. 1001270B_150601_E10]